MTFANLSQTVTKDGETFNLQVSKNHHYGETMFCLAFAISSMLRNSLLKYGKCNVKKIKANNFHKRLRNEIIMGPIPKAKYFDSKNSTSNRVGRAWPTYRGKGRGTPATGKPVAWQTWNRKVWQTRGICRLNSGVFGIFKLSACKLYLNSSGCRASKII